MPTLVVALSLLHPLLSMLPILVCGSIIDYSTTTDLQAFITVWSMTCLAGYAACMVQVRIDYNRSYLLRQITAIPPTAVWLSIVASSFTGPLRLFFNYVQECLRRHAITHLCLNFKRSLVLSDYNGSLPSFPTPLSGLQVFLEADVPERPFLFFDCHALVYDVVGSIRSSLELFSLTVTRITNRNECLSLVYLLEEKMPICVQRLRRVAILLVHRRRTVLSAAFRNHASRVAMALRQLQDGRLQVRFQVDDDLF